MALKQVVIKVKGDTKGLDPTIKKLQKLGKIDKENAASFKKTSKEFQSSTKKSGNLMDGLGKKALALGAALIGAFAIKQVIGNVITTLKDFEKAMSELSAITGATGKDLKFLEEQAKRIGRTTTISAKEAVIAFKLMASAKPELLKAKEALAEVTDEAVKLAEASGLDLPTAIEALAITLNSMDLAADQAGRVVNVLSAASLKGAKEIPFLTFALSKFGGVAASAGVSIETSAAAIELLGEKIPQAETVGTNLRNIIIQLQIEAQKQGRTFNDLGEELDLLAPKLDDVTFLNKTFGKESILAIQTLIKQRDRLGDLTEAITDTNAAQEQQIVNTDNLDSSLKKLSNSWEVYVLGLSDSAGILKTVVDGLVDFVNVMIMANKTVDEIKKEVFLKSLGEQAKEATEDFDKFVKRVVELGGSFDSLKVASERFLKIDKDRLELLRKDEEANKTHIAILENRIKAINDYVEIQGKANKSTDDGKDATIVAGSAVKAFNKLIAGLKAELEEQALAGNISKDTLNEYAAATRKAEKASNALSRAIGNMTFDYKRLKPILDDNLEAMEALDPDLVIFDDDDLTKVEKFWRSYGDGIQAAGDLAMNFAAIKSGLIERDLQEEQIAFDTKMGQLQTRLDNELISEEKFNEGKIKLEKDFDTKRAEFQTKQAKADKAAQIFSSIINTLSAIVQALPNIPLSVIIGVLGATQTAAIAAQPIPKFHKGKRGEYSDEEFPAMIRKSEYVIPPEQSRKHRDDLDAMLHNKFEKFVFMKYQMPIIKQYSKAGQATFSDFDIIQHQRKQSQLVKETNQLLRQMLPSMKRASIGWD
ncbi:MAG: phage tail tape measure protein [Candidatus Anammoxibacter sp.]